jgi:4-hydroxyphenylpyruvate dioxygenase
MPNRSPSRSASRVNMGRVHAPGRFVCRTQRWRCATPCSAAPVQTPVGPMELSIPAIEGIGGSLIYLVDRYGEQSIYDVDFRSVTRPAGVPNAGLRYIDHLTHNVQRGNMDKWAGFYERLFGFREIRYFDIEGQKTGLFSRAMASPCGKIRIPINESQDDKSQIEEYLRTYHGEGIQHIALATDDIYRTVDVLRSQGIAFRDTPDAYYEGIAAPVPGHSEPLDALRKRRVLIDGNATNGEGILLQIFTQNVIGPIFFEIIQRKGNEGFGEGNFQALFKSIEIDQMRRGVL